MPVSWKYADDLIRLGGVGPRRIALEDADRQAGTARAVLADLTNQPGVILADEVGMGKTYVALAVIASVLHSEPNSHRPIVVMVPAGLVHKWRREWDQFKAQCATTPGAWNWVRDAVVDSPTEFFRLLDDAKATRPHIIWMSTGCFSSGLQDPWLKLAFVRLARAQTKMDDEAKKRLYKWASTLVRLSSRGKLTPEIVEQLLTADLTQWHRLLIRSGLLGTDADDPIPEHLLRHGSRLDLGGLAAVLRGDLPGRQGRVSSARLNETRGDFNKECQDVYWQWLRIARWRAPLLVLDEAHHAKNDSTRLSQLLRSEESVKLMEGATEKERPLLYDKFDRMLFLTATPFQLGHQELIRVLRSFSAANWSTRSAPVQSREAFLGALESLEGKLDRNRAAGRQLDRLWGKLRPGQASQGDIGQGRPLHGPPWWRQTADEAGDPLEREIIRAIEACKATKEIAQTDKAAPWTGLRRWVIRHNRPTVLQRRADDPPIQRREMKAGAAINHGDEHPNSDRGLLITADQALPFLLAARAQGELATGSHRTRAFFAEGLCSSYEAFHHTREARGDIRDVNDDGIEIVNPQSKGTRLDSLVPVSWYEKHISTMVPSKDSPDAARRDHPKLAAVIKRVTDLWLAGEKVLVFCFYRQTAQALRDHIAGAIDDAAVGLAGDKLGLDPVRGQREIHQLLDRISRRLADEKSPFHRELVSQLSEPFERPEFAALRSRQDEFVSLLASYMRTPTYLSRYLPLDRKEIRDALATGEGRPTVVRAGVEALRHAFGEQTDGSSLTMQARVAEFLKFANDLAERSVGAGVDRPNLLDEYVGALGAYDTSRPSKDTDGGAVETRSAVRSYRALPVVRMVYGSTPQDVRDRLMLAFNSPLFPEVLVSSAVLAEGVDLHRFCRHVIHHDLCWNPSTLEQRTGRVDRIRCKAETAGKPIVIYQPYLAGSADEKMFRVVRDRERWFQIVMGQKFEMDEAASEKLAERVPLPGALAADLVFDLRRHGDGIAAGE